MSEGGHKLAPQSWMLARIKWVHGLALGAQEKLVLYTLAAYTNSAGWCFPGVERMARDTQLSERTVQYALRVLEGLALVRVRREARGRTRYFLDESVRVLPAVEGASVRERAEAFGPPMGALGAPIEGARSDGQGCTPCTGGVHPVRRKGAPGAPEGIQEVFQLRDPEKDNARAREDAAPDGRYDGRAIVRGLALKLKA